MLVGVPRDALFGGSILEVSRGLIRRVWGGASWQLRGQKLLGLKASWGILGGGSLMGLSDPKGRQGHSCRSEKRLGFEWP